VKKIFSEFLTKFNFLTIDNVDFSDGDESIANLKTIENFPEEKMTKPIKCILNFYCKRPKNHFRTGSKSHILKDTSPKYNTNNKDLDNMVKFVLDALNDKLYTDDSLIFEITCSKMYSDNEGYIYAKFSEVDDV
jgi:Holliday junction resolvase RusA-like endonuclease